jgi:PIN domain nuclease of toxin-antitoxin system
VLIDTHVWIWAADGGTRLGPKARKRLARPPVRYAGDLLAISAASVFEVVALHTAGRLHFAVPVERWVRESIEKGGLQVLDLEREIAVDAAMVPPSALSDPIDRMLVATAREYDLPLVTADRKVLDYGKRTGLVRVVDASV